MESMDTAWNHLSKCKRDPSFTIAEKNEMVIGGAVPSWVKSIPGPIYSSNISIERPRSPAYTIGKSGSSRNSAKNATFSSGPGPTRYTVNVNAVLPSKPAFTMASGRDAAATRRASRPSSAASDGKVRDASSPPVDIAFNATRAVAPKYSIGLKSDVQIGGAVPSWVKTIPGPAKYQYNADIYRRSSPKFTIGKKLKSESDLRATRSPDKFYDGAAQDAKKQELVDGTRPRTPAASFGIGARWQGPVSRMASSGALSRYEKGKFLLGSDAAAIPDVAEVEITALTSASEITAATEQPVENPEADKM